MYGERAAAGKSWDMKDRARAWELRQREEVGDEDRDQA